MAYIIAKWLRFVNTVMFTHPLIETIDSIRYRLYVLNSLRGVPAYSQGERVMSQEYDATVDLVEDVITGSLYKKDPDKETLAIVRFGNGQQGHFQMAPGHVRPGQVWRIRACPQWPQVTPVRALDDD